MCLQAHCALRRQPRPTVPRRERATVQALPPAKQRQLQPRAQQLERVPRQPRRALRRSGAARRAARRQRLTDQASCKSRAFTPVLAWSPRPACGSYTTCAC